MPDGNIFDQIHAEAADTPAPTQSTPASSSSAGTIFDQIHAESQAAKPNETSPAENPSFINRYSEVTTGVQHPLEQAESEGKMLVQHPLSTLGKAAVQAGKGTRDFAYNLMVHPVDTLKSLSGGPEFAKDWSSKNYSGMAGDIAGGLTNAILLGKGGYETGAALVSSAKDVLPEMVGEAAEKARQKLGMKVSTKAATEVPPAGRVQPALANTPQEVLRHASQEGIEITPAQGTQTPVARNVQAVGERSLLGGAKLTNALTENKLKFFDSYDNFIRKVDPEMKGSSPEEAGERLARDVADKKEATHTAATAAYSTFPELQDLKVNVSDVQKKWVQTRQSMDTVLANAPSETAGKLRQVLNLGAELGTPVPGDLPVKIAEMPFKDAMQLRSFFREMGETNIEDLPSRYQGMFKQLTSDLDDAMEKTAKDAGSEDLWRQANQGWKDYAQTYGDQKSPLNRALAQKPEKAVSDIVARKNTVDVEALQKEGVDLAPIKQVVLTDIMKKGFRVTAQGLGGYSHGFLRTLLGPDVAKELYLKADIARRLGFEVNPSGTSNVEVTLEQLVGPRKLLMSVGGAKMSMPREATKLLPTKPSIGAPVPSTPDIQGPVIAAGTKLEQQQNSDSTEP